MNLIQENTHQHTAIISDLHLCEAEPVHPKFPLWKKFKTREFFFDETFADFLLHIQERAKQQPVELVLNGDILDFDSVLSYPTNPPFRIRWVEKHRGLRPSPERSKYKLQAILRDHEIFVQALREFILKGNKVVFVIGNHDLEMHFHSVQNEFYKIMDLPPEKKYLLNIVEWFYVSNSDTMIEHGNQYDPYCVCKDPINPFSQNYNYKTMQLPFGNLACRYLVNGMGFFNPHVDANYIMSLKEYVYFFIKYMARAQPELVFTWFFGAILTLWRAFRDQLNTPIRDPLTIEDRVNSIARLANVEPRVVRELKELFATSASENPFLISRELWLDRAFLIFLGFFLIFEVMIFIRQVYDVSFLWAFFPLFLLLPFFLFYSKSVVSRVSSYKEPDEKILATTAAITNTNRIVYGHTHQALHEMIGAVEHLNSGTWSPAFLDVECTRAIDQKTFVWIFPEQAGSRQAQLRTFKNKTSEELTRRKS